MIDVYLPIDQSVLDHIDRGSGIVGSFWRGSERLTIDYEGGRYHSSNIVTFADRVMVATGRHREHYPTVARLAVDPVSVKRIGSYDESRRIELAMDAIDSLAAWIGCSVADLPTQLSVTR